MNKRRKNRLTLIVVFLLLAALAYLAADRFLIRHVEIADVNAYSTTIITTMSAQVADIPQQSLQTTDEAPQQPVTPQTITADDWHYRSDTLSISIEKVTSGTGMSALTYFVADVVLSDATQLNRAFADDQYGRNIVADTSDIADDHQAIFAINGDYYGFRTDQDIVSSRGGSRS